MILTTFDEKLYDELLLVVKLFYTQNELDNLDLTITHSYTFVDDNIVNNVTLYGVFDKKHTRTDKFTDQLYGNKKYKYIKRFAKLTLYECLSKATKKRLPWGALTGIRPTKLLYELYGECGDLDKATKMLIRDFYVSKQKAQIAKDIIINQAPIVKNDKVVDFYVHIPFCPTRCSYCSFISNGLDNCKHLFEPYLTALHRDIIETKKFLDNYGYTIKTVYIGGGTPTVLSASELDKLLSLLKFNIKEFTVESGRPDTITKDKLDVMAKHNVTRICINPQSFNDVTLSNIGRRHTSQDVLDAYDIASKYNFDINMDLIAGLDGESFNDFKHSLTKTIKLAPANITVHTLSIKRASNLHQFGGATSTSDQTNKMVKYAYSTLKKFGYKPYYLYRQKNMVGNLENVGYFRDNSINIFNIDSMEEVASIVACGAGAVSKRYYSSTDRIERFGELKNIKEYVERIDEMIANKKKLFK